MRASLAVLLSCLLIPIAPAIAFEDPPEGSKASIRPLKPLPFPQASTAQAFSLQPSRFEELREQFLRGELPVPQQVQGTWEGRCYLYGRPNLPERSVLVFESLPAQRGSLDDGPGFTSTAPSEDWVMQEYETGSASITKVEVNEKYRLNVVQAIDGSWATYGYTRQTSLRKYEGYWVVESRDTTTPQKFALRYCYFFKKVLEKP